jgi:hypothetical protein
MHQAFLQRVSNMVINGFVSAVFWSEEESPVILSLINEMTLLGIFAFLKNCRNNPMTYNVLCLPALGDDLRRRTGPVTNTVIDSFDASPGEALSAI